MPPRSPASSSPSLFGLRALAMLGPGRDAVSAEPRLISPSGHIVRLDPIDAPRARNRDEAIELFVQNEAESASPRHPRDVAWLRELGGVMYDRGYDPDGVRRQTEALQKSSDRTPLLLRIAVPTTILHGSDDQLIDVAASTAMHALIRGSTLTVHAGMGHELPRSLWDQIVDQISENARRATGR